MKLLSIEFGERGVELICADNANLDEASTVVTARLPMDPQEDKSLAWNRYFALQQLQTLLTQQIDLQRNIANGVA